MLGDQPDLFGRVASDATAWRVLAAFDEKALAGLRQARAAARETAWAQAAETRGGLPASAAAGVEIAGSVLDVDASIVVCHSEKESAAKTWKKSFGYHPIFCFLDNTREALAAMLQPGNAGSNTTADHIEVLDRALAQIPDAYRHGEPILIRCDSAGCTQGFLAHIRGLREHGINTRFSVGSLSTSRSGPRSPRCQRQSGRQPSTPTVRSARARGLLRSPTWSTPAATRRAPG